jgi:hypothetical protein
MALQNDNLSGGAAIDQCAPVVTDEDVQNLNQIASNPTDYLFSGTKLSKQDIRAMQHFVEESQTCGKRFIADIPAMDSLLYVMEILASHGGPISPTDVLMLRQLALADSGLTSQEKTSLGSCQSQNLSESDRLALHKYIDLAAQSNGLTGFPLFMRLQLFQIIIQNLGQGFTLEDVEVLRKNTLHMMGLSNQEISTLYRLSHLPEGSRLTDQEASVIEKWVRIENAFPMYTLMDFATFASLHALIQDQSSPPLSPQVVSNDRKAFQKISHEGVVTVIPPGVMQTLEEMIKNRGDYIRGSLKLRQEQIQAGNGFLLAMVQFGKVPGLNAVQVGELLELMQRSPSFQGHENIQRVLYLESVKNGFTWQQKRDFKALMKNPQASLSQSQVSLLKMYIAKAKEDGGLNGFSTQEKALLLFIIENNRGTYFTPSDVTVLRQAEIRSTNLLEGNSSAPREISPSQERQIQISPNESMDEQMRQSFQQQQMVPQMPPNPSPGPKGPGPERVP